MTTNILAAALALSDQDLLARLDLLATKEREATVQLVAHLAALDSRPAIYAGQGYGCLFAYCMQALRLSEDATANRIAAARACRRFPLILDRLASGALTLSSVRVLARHLTPENHRAVLDRASGKSRREVEALVAELAPRPDVPTSVRKLSPVRVATSSVPWPAGPGSSATPAAPAPIAPQPATDSTDAPSVPVWRPAARPVLQATSPHRYRVQFTIGQETHDKLRRLQTLLRREVPDGDPAVLFDRALSLLLEKVEKTKLAAAARPRPPIRPGADDSRRSRHIPREVRRAVWQRDGGQCAFVSAAGRRCSERTFLELHHVVPYAWRGPATVVNLALRCRRHNQYEAELIFGPRDGRGGDFARDAPRPGTATTAPS